MSPEFGVLLLLLTFGCTLYAVIAGLIGARPGADQWAQSGANAIIAGFPLLTAACLLMLGLLASGAYGVEFVWSVTDRTAPMYLRLTALWGGQAGSLLFWAWLMSGFAAGAVLRRWGPEERPLLGHVVAVLGGTLLFFLALTTFWENPFARFWQAPNGEVVSALFGPAPLLSDLGALMTRLGESLPGIAGVVIGGLVPAAPPFGAFPLNPPDGQGLEPLLRHIGMIVHPPLLYLGFTGFVVPYAFAVAALAHGDVSDAWIRLTRRWTLIAWLFLSLGLIIGGRWAYDVIGWGGYWGWDPVENAALMPWLTGTAFLHSVMIQEKRGMLKRWNMVLVTLTFIQVIMGTFLTRSGLLSSVHSFAQSAIGPIFFVFVALILVLSVWLLSTRWTALKSEHELDGLLSRETMFLLNNLVFIGINIAVAAGTYAPLVTEFLADFIPGMEKSSYGPEFYERTTAPLWALMLLLMGVAPLVAWKRASWARLGTAMLYPLGFTVIGVLLLYFGLGIVNIGALIGYGLALLALTVTLLEFHRGAQARRSAHGEGYLKGLLNVIERGRRRYGGYLIHFGVIVMAIGIISEGTYKLETQQTISTGQTITLGDYVVEYVALERFMATDGRSVARANVNLYREGSQVDALTPRIDLYDTGRVMTIPDTYGTPIGDDLYVRLIDWQPVGQAGATFKVYYNPLIRWVWSGGFIFIVGTLVAAWPDRREEADIRLTAARPAANAAGD